MNRWLVVSLICFCLAVCTGFALATGPGDLMAAHAQELAAPAAPDIVNGDTGATVTAVVQQAAPLVPGKTGLLLALFAPLIGMLTNVFLRWRKLTTLWGTKRPDDVARRWNNIHAICAGR